MYQRFSLSRMIFGLLAAVLGASTLFIPPDLITGSMTGLAKGIASLVPFFGTALVIIGGSVVMIEVVHKISDPSLAPTPDTDRVPDDLRENLRSTGMLSSEPPRRGVTIAEVIADHDGLLTEWRDHTNDDIDLVFAHPFLADVTEPLVSDHLKAMEIARGLRPDDPKKFRGPVSESDYFNAVFDLRMKWQAALRRSTQIRDSGISATDRKILREAKDLWAIVSAESASANERASAAKLLASKLERLGLAQSADNSRVFAEIEAIRRKALTIGGL